MTIDGAHHRAARRGLLRCAVAAALFGATTPFATRIAQQTSAPLLAGLLYLGAALAVLPFTRRRPPPGALRRGAGRLATAVVAGGFAGPLLLAAGLARTPPATSALLLNTELVATTLLAALFFGEHLGRRLLTGTGLVVAAGLCLAWSDSPDLRAGALLIVAACACWGLDNCVTAQLDTITPEQLTLLKGAVAGGTNLLLGLGLGGTLPGTGATVGALALGAAGYGASITLWVAGARDLGAARAQLVFSTAPFLGVALAWTVLAEPVRTVELIALGLAGAGVISVYGSDHAHHHEHEALQHAHDHEHAGDAHHAHHTGDVAGDGRRGSGPAGDGPAGADADPGRHTHPHAHEPLHHAHPHVPDLHHRHDR
jgi:drug/metabolite transporter (DMT)-like permease